MKHLRTLQLTACTILYPMNLSIPKNQNMYTSTFPECFTAHGSKSHTQICRALSSPGWKRTDCTTQNFSWKSKGFEDLIASKQKCHANTKIHLQNLMEGMWVVVLVVPQIAPSQCHSCQGLPYSSLPRKCPQPV